MFGSGYGHRRVEGSRPRPPSVRSRRPGCTGVVYNFIEEFETTTNVQYENIDDLSSEMNHIKELIVLTKAYQAKEALENISKNLAPNALIFLLCNGGLALYEELKNSKKLSHVNLIPGVTTHGAFRRPDAIHPLCAVNAGGNGNNWFGLINDVNDKIVNNVNDENKMIQNYHAVLNFLKQANLGGDDETDNAAIIRRLWIKLGVNCVMNPHTALIECTNGNFLNSKTGLKSMKHVCNEVARISSFDRNCHPPIEANELMSFITTKVNRDNKSSMLQDVINNNLTEIDYLNGWVAKRSKEEGFEALTNETLTNLIKMKEENYGGLI